MFLPVLKRSLHAGNHATPSISTLREVPDGFPPVVSP